MNGFRETLEKIKTRDAGIGIVGLGYAGLPLGLAFAGVGYAVRGFDRDVARVNALASGTLPFAGDEPGLAELLAQVRASGRFTVSADPRSLAGSDAFIVAVDTPVADDRSPANGNLASAMRTIAEHARPGAVIVVESTVAPGTIDTLVIPTLERAGLRVGDDVHVLHCPERQRSRALLANLRAMARVIGGDGPAATALGVALYRQVVEAPMDTVHYRTAEVVKTAENAARDVQIALGNQLAVVCDAVGVEIDEVRALVNRLWRDEPLVLEPGLGAGGHCLPKDSWLLVSGLADPRERGLVEGARAMNEHMVLHAATLAASLLTGREGGLDGAIVAILGTAYKPDADDERGSRAVELGRLLEERGAWARYHDPVVARRRVRPLEDVLAGADLLVLAVPHSAYRALDPVTLCRNARIGAVLDVVRVWDGEAFRAAGLAYRALGRGRVPRAGGAGAPVGP